MRAPEERRDPLHRAALSWPDAPALEWHGGSWTFRELDRRVDAATARLRRAGAEPDTRVALVLNNNPAAVLHLLAVARAGAVAAPLSPRLKLPEVADALRVLEPVLLVYDEPEGSPARSAAWGRDVPVERVDPSGEVDGDDHPGAPGDEPRSRWPSPERDRAVLWTSGTSGRPRGVRLTEGNLAASAAGAWQRLDLAPGDRWYASLSVAHVGGLALVDRAVRVGATLEVRGRFEARRFLALARSARVTHASLVPVMLKRVLEANDDAPAPEGFRCLLIGGDRAPSDLLERARESGWPVALTYGLTEACSQVATAPPELVRRKPDTVGPPLPGVEVRIGEDDEIRVRGPTVVPGYVGGEPLGLDDDGWLRTGDRGALDDEGHLRVTGRLSDRIVSGGVTVDPHEVEEVLRSLPGVEDAAVVGLPDREWGERVVAVLVAPSMDQALGKRLFELMSQRLAGPKLPRSLAYAHAIPRNRNGKVDRKAVLELFRKRRYP